MGFHFEIGFAFAFEGAFSRLLQPFLKTVLTRVALQRVHEHTMANAAFELFGEEFLVDNALSVYDVVFGLLLTRGVTLFA
jgi:hypothetical protein